MKDTIRILPLVFALAGAVALPQRASATSDGIFDVSKAEGCSCHGQGPHTLPASPTVVKMLVDDQPAELFAGYEPGATYELTVWVVGPIVPFAGFNLIASAGSLEPVDASVRTIVHNECEKMARTTYPPNKCNVQNGAPSNDKCTIVDDPDCPVWDTSNPACKTCDGSVCRECDATRIVDVQATHTGESALPVALPVGPSPLPFFTMTWTAPADGTAEVTFHLAGNSVDGAGGNSMETDVWNFSDPYPIVLSATAAE